MYLYLKAQPYNYMYDVLYKYFLKSVKKSNQKQTTSQNSIIALLNSAIFICTSFTTNIQVPSTLPPPKKTFTFLRFCLFVCLFICFWQSALLSMSSIIVHQNMSPFHLFSNHMLIFSQKIFSFSSELWYCTGCGPHCLYRQFSSNQISMDMSFSSFRIQFCLSS